MRVRGFASRATVALFAFAASVSVLATQRSVQAARPVVTLSAAGVRVEIASAPLSEAIDALSRAAGFKVTYEGPRPTARLFNVEIGTPTVAEAVFRLLDGQDVNYGVVFDPTGKRVTLLMMLGPASKRVAIPAAAPGRPSPQPFTTPRDRRNDPLPFVEDPAEVEAPEPEPATPEPTPEASPPPIEPGGAGGAPTVVLPPSPFVRRPLVVSPFAPRYTPPPSPSPSP